MSNADSAVFGRTVARLRLARGLNQQQVAARIPTYYSDAGAYGRIERGERRPDREAAIAILIRGLLLDEIAAINRYLELANFEGLSTEEIERYDLPVPASETSGPAPDGKPGAPPLSRRAWGILVCSLFVAGLEALFIPQHAVFALLSSGLYAALYAVSLLLESAFEPSPEAGEAAALIFGLMAASSMGALAGDRLLIDSGSPLALASALAIFLVAAVLQFFLARAALSESPIVPATFQTQTAQGAHLKNTGYFLLITVVFWLPAFHAMLMFEHELRAGQGDWVRQIIERDLMIGHGLIALSVRSLLALLLVMLLASVYMRHVLLDNLRPHPRLNSFTLLFDLRAFLYFLLSLVCIGWYALSLAEFR